MEETKRLLGEMHEDTNLLRKDMGLLRRSMNRRHKAGVWVAAMFVLILLVAGLFIYRDRQFRGCMTSWAGDLTDRTVSLSGPGNDRINFFLQAYTEAAGAKHTPLTAAAKAALIAGLDRDRRQFASIPKHAALVKEPETQLLAFRDLLRSLRANVAYQQQAASHPVPTAPTCGGIL